MSATAYDSPAYRQAYSRINGMVGGGRAWRTVTFGVGRAAPPPTARSGCASERWRPAIPATSWAAAATWG